MKQLIILSSASLLSAMMLSTVWADNTVTAVAAAPNAVTTSTSSTTEASPSTAAVNPAATPTINAAKEVPAATTPTEVKVVSSAPEKKIDSTPAAPELYIISPKEGEEVTSPVTVVFGLKGMGVAPAGVEKANTGHHHLLIDKAELPPAGIAMGADVQHFGGGQTQTEVELSAGEHSLQLILGDMSHVPISPVLSSEKITIKVK